MSTTTAALPVSRRQSLNRHRVYIFPTRHGFMLGSMMFVILLGSINYDNALGYLLTFLLFGLFLVTMLHTYRNLVGLAYLGAEAKPVFAGEPVAYALGFDNRGMWPRYSMEVAHWPVAKWRWRRRRRRRPPVSNRGVIETDGPSHMTLRLPGVTRGWVSLDRIRIASTFPLGVLRAWAYFVDDTRCLVYPKPQGPLPLPVDGTAASSSAGGAHAGNDDFAGFRRYQPGDPIRAIAWKNLARQDTVLVKRFTSGASERIELGWRHCAALGDTEARLSQLCAWIVEADRLGVHYGLDIPGHCIPPGTGAAHRHRCLKSLALYD